VDSFELPPDDDALGVGVDANDEVWVFGAHTSTIDAATGVRSPALEDCDGPCLDEGGGFDFCGDITGLRWRDQTGHLGSWSTVFEGCSEGPTNWLDVSSTAHIPAGARATLYARTAPTLDDLPSARWISLGAPGGPEPASLDEAFGAAAVEDQAFLEVRAELETEPAGESPALGGVSVRWACPSQIE
jgi:hypothetical protein